MGGNANRIKVNKITHEVKSESESQDKRRKVTNSDSVNTVNAAMLVIVMSQLVILNTASTRIGVKRKFETQNLEGQIIHDDGSSSHGRCNRGEFISGTLKQYSNVIVSGVTGSQSNPYLGVVQDGSEKIRNVILLENQNYGIDSPYQLVDVQGYKEDKSCDHYMKRYYKVVDGVTIEKLYIRKPGWTHFIRVNSMSTMDQQIQTIVNKMAIIHENMGHPSANVMVEMCEQYPVSMLGFTRFEALIWQKHGDCKACLEGKGTARRKDKQGRLINVQYSDYGNMEGLHFDCFQINNQWGFLLVKSHKTNMTWVFHVSIGYTTDIIKDCLETVIGDYRYTGNELGFLRSDADTKFFALRGWAQRLGLRYYMAPKKVKTSRAERGVRTEKDMTRTLLHHVKYPVPKHWIPYAVFDANQQLTIRYNKDLGMSPREKFYGEKFNYKKHCFIHFGQIISYPPVQTTSSIHQSRLNHGAVVGREIETGNLWVENLETKKLDKVTVYNQIIKVDKNIQMYFKNYDKVSGFKYHKDHLFAVVNNQMISINCQQSAEDQRNAEENPVNPAGPLHCNRMEAFNEYQAQQKVDNSIKFQSSYERFANLSGEELEANLYDDEFSSSDEFDDTEDNNSPYHKVAEGDKRRRGNRNREIFKNHENIALMIMSVMKELIPNASDEDIVTMSNSVAHELDTGQEVNGFNIEELFINSESDPHHNINLITNLVQMSYRKMYKRRPDLTKAAGIAEMKTVSDRDTFHGVHFKDIPSTEKILYIMTKYAEKFKLGEFDKVKARLLLGGNVLWDDYQLRWDEISSRTIALASLYTLVTLMAHEQMDVLTMDFKNAFLYGLLPEADQCYARIPADESQLLLEIDEAKWRPYYNKEEKCIYVKVVRSLYGHPAAAKIFYDYLKNKLALIGFTPLKCEPCIFVRTVDGQVEFLGIHVDDLIMGSKNGAKLKEDMIKFRAEHFNGEGTISDGPNHEYLNMLFEFNKAMKSVEVSQESYWKSVCAKFDVKEQLAPVTIPHSSDYMTRLRNRNDALDTNQPADEGLMKKFLSMVMSILWGVQRSKPELGVNVSYLAGEAKHASEEDCKDVDRTLKYINQCKSDKIRFQIKGDVQVSCFIDSSAHTGPTCLGQAGCVISIGSEGFGGPIEAKSARSKNNHVGSMPYELDALHHMISGPIFIRELLDELGYKQGPILVFEDNKALIDLIRRGKVSTGVTRHIAAKYYYAKDLIAEGIIVLRHCPTRLMIADILTKHLGGPDFIRMSKRLRNVIEQDPTLDDVVYRKLYLNSSEEVYKDEDIKVIKLLSMVIQFINENQP
jgi:hypothetical protein